MTPALRAIAATHGGVFTRGAAVTCLGRGETERLLRRGSLRVVRHGVLIEAELWDVVAATAAGEAFVRAAARRLALGARDVISHETAAVLHGLDLLSPYDGVPALTRVRQNGTAPAKVLGLYAAAVPAGRQQLIRGLPVTTPARTVADLARGTDREAARVVVDAALRRGLDRRDVLDVLEECTGWPGAARAREVVICASQWSETALESRATCWFEDQGLPRPLQQRVLRSLTGRFLARVDFVWPQYRTVCELDGRKKFTVLDADGSALWKEKRREDDLRDVGLEVVRGYWSDGHDRGAALAARLRRAFARGLRADGDPAYLIIAPSLPRDRPLARAG